MIDNSIKSYQIGLFALANAPDSQKTGIGLKNYIQLTGHKVVINNITPSGPRHLAAPDDLRAKNFNELLDNPEINGLVAIRGGYGVTRILEKIDFEQLKRRNCFVCGYSDITALLLAAWKFGCRKLIHGPMIQSSWAADLASEELLLEARSYLDVLATVENPNATRDIWPLAEKLKKSISNSNAKFYDKSNELKVLKDGVSSGPLVPMNLTLLCALLGTDFLPDLTGTILAVEDVAEPAHAIDRNLNHLRQAGILRRLGGLVFGKFTNAEDGEFLPEIQREFAEFVPGPVIANFPFGHEHPAIALPFGWPAQLDTTRFHG